MDQVAEPELSKDACDKAIEERPFPKVTMDSMKSRITNVTYMHPAENVTVTVCNVTLDNGYSVRGESACVDPRNFDLDIGRRLAYENAVSKLWPLFGFLLAEDMHKDAQLPKMDPAV